LFALAALGWLRPGPIIALLIVAIAGGAMRARFAASVSKGWMVAYVAIGMPAFLLALHPPLAFDETLYHLPFVRSLATAGGLRFLTELRFPVFPQLHELLCAPVYLLAGDVATHLVSLAEVMVTISLVAAWARRYTARAAPPAAALFIGSPIVVHLATILHVDAALTLFVTAGFYALDVALTEPRRASLLYSALFFGAACSVKYLGGYFAVAALVIVLAARRRDALLFAGVTSAAALPTTLWLALTTGNPLFPFLPRLFGPNDWVLPPDVARPHRVMDGLRVLWDVTFARERMNAQPPMTPLLIVLVLFVSAAAFRNRRARAVMLLASGYLILFAFLPQDTRYLVPLLPLLSVSAAVIMARRLPRATAIATLVAIVPGVAYLVWRLAISGLPPADAASRNAETAGQVAGYAALARAGTSRVYVCGGEQLQYYAAGTLLGDFSGPYSYDRVLAGADDTATLAARLLRLDIAYFLALKQRCDTRRMTGGLVLVHEDSGAQLWRVQTGAPR
jgi:4-amino-4-deoxy-L-arabinose transferase-like glycosyltransferase